MKSKLEVGFVVMLVTIIITMVFTLSAQNREFYARSLKFNYEVPDYGAPVLINPVDQKRAQLLVYTQLPYDCWQKSDWMKGEYGRISIYKGKCEVDPNASWRAEDQTKGR